MHQLLCCSHDGLKKIRSENRITEVNSEIDLVTTAPATGETVPHLVSNQSAFKVGLHTSKVKPIVGLVQQSLLQVIGDVWEGIGERSITIQLPSR